jgi:hypothetical protein
MLCHDSLANLYQVNFAMMQHYKYSLTELEEMMPWEREIYVSLLMKHINDENERIKNQQNQR